MLKIDVEGDELAVLRGIEPQHWGRIEQVAMEVHAVGDRLQHVRDLLAAEGFEVYVDEDEELAPRGVDNHNVYALRPAKSRRSTISTKKPGDAPGVW